MRRIVASLAIALTTTTMLALATPPAGATPENARAPQSSEPTVHWRQVLRRLGFWTGSHASRIYLDQIPLSDWLDPELHRVMREAATRPLGATVDGDQLIDRMSWAFSQKPELARVWLPENDSRITQRSLNYVHRSPNNPFLPDPAHYYRDAVRRNLSDAELVKEVIGSIDPKRKPRRDWQLNRDRAFWDEIARIQAADPSVTDQILATLLKQVDAPRDVLVLHGVDEVFRHSPALALRLSEARPDAAITADRRRLLGPEPYLRFLRDQPALRMKLLAAEIKAGTFPTDDLWLRFPDTAAALRAHLQGLRLSDWAKPDLQAAFLNSPWFERWLQEFPEPWMIEQLGAAAPGTIAPKVLTDYSRAHPPARELIVKRFPDAAGHFYADTPALRPRLATPENQAGFDVAIARKDTSFELPPLAVLERARLKPGNRDASAGTLPAIRPSPHPAPEEDEGRLALGDAKEVRYRGLRDDMVSPGLHDPRFQKGVQEGRAARLRVLEQGRKSLAAKGVELNPFAWLHRGLETFIRSQTQAVPRLKALAPHEIDRRVNEAMQDWPDDPRNLVDQFHRQKYEEGIRRRLGFEELPSRHLALRNLVPPAVDPSAFAAWRRRSLARLESDYRRNLLHAQAELGAHGFQLVDEATRAPVTAARLEQLRLDERGQWIDPTGETVSLAIPGLNGNAETALLAGPTRLTPEQLAEHGALVDGFDAMRGSYALAARSLGRDAVKAELLLNYYDWNRQEKAPTGERPQAAPVRDFLWSRVDGGTNPNAWRDFQARAIAENRRAEPFFSRGFREGVGKMATAAILVGGFLGAATGIAGGTVWLFPGLAGEQQSSGRFGNAGLENPGSPTEGEKKPRYRLTFHSESGSTREADRPKYFSQGRESEFKTAQADAFRVPQARMFVMSKGSAVQVRAEGLTRPDENGLIPLLRPEGTTLRLLTLDYFDGKEIKVVDPKNYVIVRDPRTHDLAVKMTQHDSEWGYGVISEFQTAPPGSFEAQELKNRGEARSFDPVLEDGIRLRTIARRLEEAGFVGLPKALEDHLPKHGGKIRSSELMRILLDQNKYSYRPTSAPKRALPSEWRMNPFMAHSAVINESGSYAGVCAAHNLLEADILNAYFRDDHPYRAEVRSSYANMNGDTELTGEEGHARAYVFESKHGSVPIILDATPSTTDGQDGKIRTDQLPSHGATPAQRRQDRAHHAQLAFLATTREQDERERFFRELAGKVKAENERPETAEEYLLRKWLTAINASEAAGNVIPADLMAPAEARKEAETAYSLGRELQQGRRAVTERGNELRRLRQLKPLLSSDPVNQVFSLTNRALDLISDAPKKAEWAARREEILADAKRVLARLRDLQILGEVARDFRMAQARGKNLALTPEQEEVIQRTKVNPVRNSLPLPQSIEDQKMREALEAQLQLISERLERFGERLPEALHQTRAYQTEHHERSLGDILGRIPALSPSCLQQVLKEIGAI